MQVFKRFVRDGKEYELSVTMYQAMMGSDLRWSLAVRWRPTGGIKWNTLLPPDDGAAGGNTASQDSARSRWVYRQVPSEWWDETLRTAFDRIRSHFNTRFAKRR